MKSLILEPKSSLVELLKNFLRTIVLFIVEIKVQKLLLLKYTQDNGIWEEILESVTFARLS